MGSKREDGFKKSLKPGGRYGEVRLNRWLADRGHCSRREGDRWIESGRLAINAQIAQLGDKVGPKDKVYLDGKLLGRKEPPLIVIAYNKPVGIECTSNPDVPNNIIDAIAHPERLVYLGRLDQMSEGLILLSNRGSLVEQTMRGSLGHEREYRVSLSHAISDEEIALLEAGVVIDDGRGRTKPCKIMRESEDVIRMVLFEGRNRQIRRMLAVVGNHVSRLERIRLMNIELGILPRGQWRELKPGEMKRFLRLSTQSQTEERVPVGKRPGRRVFVPSSNSRKKASNSK